MCLAGNVVASWSLIQQVLGGMFESFFCSDKYFFITEFSEFSENI